MRFTLTFQIAESMGFTRSEKDNPAQTLALALEFAQQSHEYFRASDLARIALAQARCQGPEVAKPTFDSAIHYVELLDALLSIRAGELAQVARRQAEVGQAEAAA